MSIFSKIAAHRLKRSEFDLSYPNDFTMKTGILYPVYAEEVVPGDIFHAGTGVVIRSQPTIAPIFTNYYAEMRYFYVPNRLVWEGFKEFLMDQKEGKKGIEKPLRVHPFQYNDGKYDIHTKEGSIYDFLNVPTACREDINPLPFRAYAMIWNEYFRDQNLQDSVEYPTTDGADTFIYSLQRVSWRKDYFTSALPWTQRGEEVDLPALVKLRSKQEILADGYQYQRLMSSGSSDFSPAALNRAEAVTGGALRGIQESEFGGSGTASNQTNLKLGYIADYSANTKIVNPAWLDPAGTLGVDINIRDLRFATAVQRFLEKEAQVGGGRYADFIRGIYGVNIGDATLQRPLYLGGGRQGINISPVEQTAATNDVSPQGNLAGKGYMSGLFRMKPTVFAEHGWVIGVMFVRPDARYYRGLNRHMSKSTRFDYLIPGFQHLGEQEILNKEVYALSYVGGTPGEIEAIHEANAGTFGYTSRQAEYKSHLGEIHGDLKTTLHQYVLARDFEDGLDQSIPLNQDFVLCDPDEDEIFAVSPDVADPWIVNGYNVAKVYRDLEKYPAYGL